MHFHIVEGKVRAILFYKMAYATKPEQKYVYGSYFKYKKN
jgi:hypothetical protein